MVVDDEAVRVQLRKGVLDYCVLAHLASGPSYGRAMATALGERGVLGSEGTLYPLLARLRKAGWVSTTWVDSEVGPARRYYELTDDGRASLAVFRTVWTDLLDGIEGLIGPTDPTAGGRG